jgi:hypothetical protein
VVSASSSIEALDPRSRGMSNSVESEELEFVVCRWFGVSRGILDLVGRYFKSISWMSRRPGSPVDLVGRHE